MRAGTLLGVVVATLVSGSCAPARRNAPAIPGPPAGVREIPLPGASPTGVSLDYLAYDGARRRVWIPAGETGTVVVLDVPNDHLAVVSGFATAEVERHGVRRRVGPSSATVGEGTIYVGNRADSSVCAIDAVSLRRGPCVTLASTPDGLAYVASRKEVWVTTPRDHSITILDAASARSLTVAGKIPLDGAPEGYAVDDAQGVFYTNLEDRDRTLAIKVARRQVTSTWQPGCGAAGPRGLAIDHTLHMLVVACTDHLVALDVADDGAVRSSLPVGDGIDNIDLVASRHEAYAAASRAATLTIVGLDAQGHLSRRATVATRAGARNAVAADGNVAYLTAAAEGQILAVTPR
jgi:hypothetical protein